MGGMLIASPVLSSRVGSLFFLGSLLAFSALSALFNLVSIRELFLRERASGLYSPVTWLLSRIVFDIVPLRMCVYHLLSYGACVNAAEDLTPMFFAEFRRSSLAS
jgi:hypothetical protein